MEDLFFSVVAAAGYLILLLFLGAVFIIGVMAVTYDLRMQIKWGLKGWEVWEFVHIPRKRPFYIRRKLKRDRDKNKIT